MWFILLLMFTIVFLMGIWWRSVAEHEFHYLGPGIVFTTLIVFGFTLGCIFGYGNWGARHSKLALKHGYGTMVMKVADGSSEFKWKHEAYAISKSTNAKHYKIMNEDIFKNVIIKEVVKEVEKPKSELEKKLDSLPNKGYPPPVSSTGKGRYDGTKYED